METISPLQELYYPDKGGYTGISICIWNTGKKNPDKYYLENEWGGVEGTAELKKSEYVLEGRFFAFGRLLDRVLIAQNSYDKLVGISNSLSSQWKDVMDEIITKTNELWEQPERRSTHISEVVTEQMITAIKTEWSK